MAESMWVGKDEHEGVRAQPRKDVKPPPHWRLEAIAQTPRPHSLTRARPARAVFIQADGRDLRRLAARPRGRRRARAPDHRPRAGRLLGRHAAAPLPGRRDRRLRRRTTTCGSCRPPAARRASSSRAASPVWIDDARLVIAVERDERHDAPGRGRRRRPVAAAPRRRARRPRRPRRRGRGRRLARRHARSPTPSRRAPTSTAAARSASPTLDGGAVRAVTGTPRMHDNSPAWSPDGATIAYASERSGFYELHLAGARGPPAHRAPAPTTSSSRGTRTARACSPSAGGATASTLVVVDAATRRGRGRRRRRHLGQPALDARRARSSAPTRTTRRRPSCASPARRARCHAPAPRATRRAPYAALEEVVVRLLRRPGDPGLPAPAAERLAGAAGARDRLSARRPDRRLRRRLGRPRAVLRRQGLRLAGAQLPRLDRLRARLRARSTTACGASTTPRTASPPPTTCARSTGSTASAWASSAPATAPTWRSPSVTDDPEHRFRCAVAKYGDCDIVTSWAQGDRDGVQDLERMMGPPSSAREAYRAGSPYHRLAERRRRRCSSPTASATSA